MRISLAITLLLSTLPAAAPLATAEMKMVAEGVSTTQSVYQKARQMGIVMPITAAVYSILYEEKDPREAVTDLMLRAPKSERH